MAKSPGDLKLKMRRGEVPQGITCLHHYRLSVVVIVQVPLRWKWKMQPSGGQFLVARCPAGRGV